MPITEISGGYRQRINVQDMNIGPGGRMDRGGLVSRSDVQAMLDHAKTNDPDYAAARNNYEFRLVRSGDAVFLDMKKRNWAGRLKARLHIGNERRANERKAAVEALNNAMGIQGDRFDAFKARTGAATNRRAATAYQVALANKLDAVEPGAVPRLRQSAPVLFVDGPTLAGTLSNVVDEVMRNRDVAQAATLLRENPGFAIQLFHHANVNRTDPEFAEVLERIAGLYDEYIKAPDLAAVDAYVAEQIMGDPASRSDLRQGLDSYLFRTTGGRVAGMAPETVNDVIQPQGVRPLQQGLVAYSIEAGGAVRSLVDGNEEFDARAIYAAEPTFLGRALRKLETLPSEQVAECLLKNVPEALLNRFNDVLRGSNEPMGDEIAFGPVLTAVENVSREKGVLGDIKRWGAEARLSDAHLAELRKVMTSAGIPDTPENFAKYLISLSALFTKISGMYGFGSHEESVLPLRYYGFMLMKASEQTSSEVLSPQEIYGYMNTQFQSREEGLEEVFIDNRCADLLGNSLIKTAVAIDRDMFGKVASPHFVNQWKDYRDPREAIRFPVARAGQEIENAPVRDAPVRVPDDEDRDDMMAMLREPSSFISDDESSQDRDDSISEDGFAFRNFIMNHMRNMNNRAPSDDEA